MFAERLELIKDRKQFNTASHLRFDKFHHNKRIALKLQRCILESFAYLCSFSWVPDPILSCRKIPLNPLHTNYAYMRSYIQDPFRRPWKKDLRAWVLL